MASAEALRALGQELKKSGHATALGRLAILDDLGFDDEHDELEAERRKGKDAKRRSQSYMQYGHSRGGAPSPSLCLTPLI